MSESSNVRRWLAIAITVLVFGGGTALLNYFAFTSRMVSIAQEPGETSGKVLQKYEHNHSFIDFMYTVGPRNFYAKMPYDGFNRISVGSEIKVYYAISDPSICSLIPPNEALSRSVFNLLATTSIVSVLSGLVAARLVLLLKRGSA